MHSLKYEVSILSLNGEALTWEVFTLIQISFYYCAHSDYYSYRTAQSVGLRLAGWSAAGCPQWFECWDWAAAWRYFSSCWWGPWCPDFETQMTGGTGYFLYKKGKLVRRGQIDWCQMRNCIFLLSFILFRSTSLFLNQLQSTSERNHYFTQYTTLI